DRGAREDEGREERREHRPVPRRGRGHHPEDDPRREPDERAVALHAVSVRCTPHEPSPPVRARLYAPLVDRRTLAAVVPALDEEATIGVVVAGAPALAAAA